MNKEHREAGVAPTPVRLEYVDVVRGVAILAVILTHTAQSFTPVIPVARAGQYGVQLFFVASAYTLMLSARRRGLQYGPFLFRRFFRIAPAYGVALFGYWIAVAAVPGLLNGTATSPRHTPLAVTANLLLFHGFVPSANNTLVPGGWSVGTEMAFYAVFPLLAGGAARAYRRWGLSALWVAFGSAVAINVAVLPLLARMTGLALGNNTFWYFSLLNNLPVFLAGIIAFYRPPQPERVVRTILVNMGVAIVSVGTTAYLLQGSDPQVQMMLPSLVSIGCASLLRLAQLLPSPRPLVLIGRISFSMYLVHFLLAWNPPAVFTSATSRTPAFLAWLGVTILGSAALAWCSERWLERPGIRLGGVLARRLQGGTRTTRA